MSLLVCKEVHICTLCLFGVLLLDLTGRRVLVANDKVYLGAQATLVWAKHDCVGSLVRKLGLQITYTHTHT